MSIIQEALKKAQRRSGSVGGPIRTPVQTPLPRQDDVPSYIQETVSTINKRPQARASGLKSAVYWLVLAAVAIAFLINFSPRHSTVAAKAAAKESIINTPSQAVRAPVSAPLQVRTHEIVPIKAPEPVENNFKLSGIMDLEDGRRAIINNIVVAEGDDIGNAMVETIESDNVVLKKGSDTLTLRLK